MPTILFRGLQFDKKIAPQEIASIRRDGIVDSAKRTSNYYGIKTPTNDALSTKGFDFRDPLWDEETFPPFACADIRSASRYASDDLDKQGVVVRFEIDPSQVYVDGRDFLIFAFQIADRWINVRSRRELMAQAFGPRILEWAECAAMQHGASETDLRINVACHACSDPQVIQAHLCSKIVLFGKASFYFCSAFRFNTPVTNTKVTLVEPEPVWGPGDLGLSFEMLGFSIK